MAKINLTPSQVEALRPYEEHFGRAIRSGWSKPLSDATIERLRSLWLEITGSEYHLQNGCGTCTLNLLSDVGWLYYNHTGIDPENTAERQEVVLHPQPAPKPAPQAKKKGKK